MINRRGEWGQNLYPRLTVQSEDDSPKTKKRTKPQTHPEMCPKPSEGAQLGESQACKKPRLEVSMIQEKNRDNQETDAKNHQESASEPEIETRGRKGEAQLVCNKAKVLQNSKGQFKAKPVHQENANGTSDNPRIMGKSGDSNLIIGSAARGGQARSSSRDYKRERTPQTDISVGTENKRSGEKPEEENWRPSP